MKGWIAVLLRKTQRQRDLGPVRGAGGHRRQRGARAQDEEGVGAGGIDGVCADDGDAGSANDRLVDN